MALEAISKETVENEPEKAGIVQEADRDRDQDLEIERSDRREDILDQDHLDPIGKEEVQAQARENVQNQADRIERDQQVQRIIMKIVIKRITKIYRKEVHKKARNLSK